MLRVTFSTLQSSLFYLFWIIYGDERHLNWSQIEPFPLPQKESLEERKEEIKSLSEELWEEMRSKFERNGQMEGISDLRSLIDDID